MYSVKYTDPVPLPCTLVQVETSAENTGFKTKLGHLPNKGGLVAKLGLGTTELCFISCHLAAHEGDDHFRARNASCEQILKGARVGDKSMYPLIGPFDRLVGPLR